MGVLGYKHTPEARAKIAAANRARVYVTRGVPKPAGFGAKIAAANRGRVLSPESRARIANALRGRPGTPWTPERRAAMSAARKGNDHLLRARPTGTCVYCLGPANTFDHMIPRGRPGWADPANVVPACFTCNRMKRNRTPDEWWDALVKDHLRRSTLSATRTNVITVIG